LPKGKVIVKHLISYAITIFGIKAPWFSWIGALILVFWPAYELLALCKLTNRGKAICIKLIGDIEPMLDQYNAVGTKGVAAIAIEHLEKHFLEFRSLTTSWHSYKAKLLYRPATRNSVEFQVWATVSASIFFDEDIFLGNGFNKRHFQTMPGIVTGIGLLLTFLAILVGLLDVSIIDNKVYGLENLIGGLSGKFISSIAALSASTAFLILEKSIFNRFNTVRRSLTVLVDRLIPARSEAQLLEELCQSISKQNSAFNNFSAELSFNLCDSFNSSMRPMLDGMIKAMMDLHQNSRGSQAELLDTIIQMNRSYHHSDETNQYLDYCKKAMT
jgi:hypothetical protein